MISLPFNWIFWSIIEKVRERTENNMNSRCVNERFSHLINGSTLHIHTSNRYYPEVIESTKFIEDISRSSHMAVAVSLVYRQQSTNYWLISLSTTTAPVDFHQIMM